MKRQVVIRGERHKAVVLLVTSCYDDGRPKTAIIVHEDQSIHISDGDQFVVAYVAERSVRPEDSEGLS